MALTYGLGLSDLVDADSGREIVVAPPLLDRFAELRGKYEEFLAVNRRYKEWILDSVQEILSPHDINLFLQSTDELENHAYYINNTGLFISKLIQNSYKTGNSDFELDVDSLRKIDYLAYEISGTEEQNVRMVIKGRAGYYCGIRAQHSILTIEQAGDLCGFQVDYSTFTIGEAGEMCGHFAKHSTFTIGEAGEMCGHLAKHSIFKTHNPDQYERLKESVPQRCWNALYLLSNTGSVLEGGKW